MDAPESQNGGIAVLDGAKRRFCKPERLDRMPGQGPVEADGFAPGTAYVA